MSTMLATGFQSWIRSAMGALFVVSLVGTLVNAAPVVWKFEATIVRIDGDVAIQDLPFALVPGQAFSGRYTFANEGDLLDMLAGLPPGKNGVMTLAIDGSEMSAAMNHGTLNGGGFVDINGPPPPPGPVSSILVGYSSPTDVFPGWGGDASGNNFGAGLALVGVEGLISSPQDALDVRVLNQLTTQRQLGLSFGRFLAGEFEVVGVVAEVGDFVSVPEPSSAWLALPLCALGLRPLVSTDRTRRGK